MSLMIYLKSKKNTLILLLLMALALTVSFVLYHLPVGAVAYPVVLCLILGGLWMLADYRKRRAHWSQVACFGQRVELADGKLPAPGDYLEEEYQKQIYDLQKKLAEQENSWEQQYSQMLDYYSMWVHQIKTPIASMKLTLEEMDSSESRRLAANLHRIEEYVSMVLTYLRLQSDSTDYVLRTIDVDDTIRTCIRRFAPDFIERKIGLEFDPTGLQIISDEKWIEFVIEQLLSNALKYTREGQISIFLKGTVLCISDTGIGIAPEDLPRIFENGYTGYNGRIGNKATGIGLFLCKKICDNLGIAMRVRSEVGAGTTFLLEMEQKVVNVRD